MTAEEDVEVERGPKLSAEEKHSLKQALNRASGEVMMPEIARRLMVRAQANAVERWLRDRDPDQA